MRPQLIELQPMGPQLIMLQPMGPQLREPLSNDIPLFEWFGIDFFEVLFYE